MSDCIIVGAGLTGSLLSLYLARLGMEVTIIERRPDMRKADITAGRSINLAISVRGIRALENVGQADRIMQHAIPMYGRMIHPLSGDCFDQPYSYTKDEHQNSISRAVLNCELMSAAEETGRIKILFQQKVSDYDPEHNQLTIEHSESHSTQTIKAPLIFAADGAYSKVRRILEQKNLMTFTADTLQHGYKELCVTKEYGDRLQKNFLHIWPRRSYMLIALPNTDNTFTCTLFMAGEGEPSFASIDDKAKLHTFFQQQFTDVYPLMPELEKDFFHNPTGSMVTVKGGPWFFEDKLCLIGDAAHAIVPFLGQGMNCAFEDCTILQQGLELFPGDYAGIFKYFYERRKANADAIAQMAVENYYEMRDHVADDHFHLRKSIEFELMQRYPGKFLAKYNLIAFHHGDYAAALRAAKLQSVLLHELCEKISSVQDINWSQHDERLQKYFIEERLCKNS